MAGDHKTKTLQELPPLNELKDSDILITSDGSTTYKVNGYDFIQYVRKHSDISGFFVHQDAVGRPEGIAPLDAASKLFSNNIPFGSSAGSVFDGASGKALSDALTSHTTDKDNPHRVTKAQIGLGNANDTSDLDKPVSTAQQAAILKAREDAGKYTDTAMSRVVDGAPKDMDTLHKAAKALEEQKKTADALSSLIGNKVDKAAGKKLSTNDYTNEEKAKLLSIENGANHYVHPDTDGCKHIPANGTANDGRYLKSTSKPGIYAWGKLAKEDVTAALGYTPTGSESVTYALSKSGSNIILTGSDGSKTSIPDADTTYTLSDFGITSSSAEINQLKGVKSNVQTQLNNVYTKNEANTLLNDKLAKAGDGSNLTTAFTEAPTLATINTGEKLSVIMGKVKKAIASLISHTGTVATASVSGHVKVDSALSSASTNPVQNKAVNTALAGKLAATGNASNTTVAYTEATALTELASGEKQSVAFGKLKLAVKNVISIARLLGTTDISAIGGGTVTGALAALNSNLADAQNVKLQLSGGDDVLSDQIYANWSKVPIGYGCISVSNSHAVRSGTYIKYSDTVGTINLNRADDGTATIWSLVNGAVKSMPTETYGIISDAGVNVGFTLRLSAGIAYISIDVMLPKMATWSAFRIGYIPEWKHGAHVLGLAHSLHGANSSTVRLNVSTDGVVTANTQQGAITEENKWFYGRSTICL